jgi:hypothetical protein
VFTLSSSFPNRCIFLKNYHKQQWAVI